MTHTPTRRPIVRTWLVVSSLALLLLPACRGVPGAPVAARTPPEGRMRLVVDTDANNELDDQHALAYVLLNGDTFDLEGITVNATRAGGGIAQHVEEARRVLALCGLDGQVPLVAGANADFATIRPAMHAGPFDGAAAVDFIIARAHAADGRPLVLLPIGKLTNIALALAKDPTIAGKVRIVWLGSNYPAPGEYNQENDPEALRYVLAQDVPFEMVTVRYGEPSGTDAIRITREEATRTLAGRGPRVETPVMGRHGTAHRTFGDYAVDLFAHIDYSGDPPSRALYDVGAAAILIDPAWARARRQPAPALVGEHWQDRPDNRRTIVVWEYFDRDAILADFHRTLAQPVPAVSARARP